MDKPKRRDRVKSESSEDEEDFESADEGEETQRDPRPPSLATSADDGKNSTSKSQVTKERTGQKTHKMAAAEPSSTLPLEKTEENENSEGDSSNTRESCPTGVDEGVDKSSSKSADSEDDHSHHLREHKPEGKEDGKPSGDSSVTQDVSDDEEIQFKIDSKKPNEDSSSELEKTQTEETLEVPHKETIQREDDNGDVQTKVQEEKGSFIEKKEQSNVEEKSKENVPDESRANVEDSSKVDQGSSENAAEAIGESSKPKSQEGGEPHCEDAWGWGGWGTMLSSVSSGLSSVIEKVETSLGIPEPEVIAQKVTEDEKQAREKQSEKVIETEPIAESPPEGPLPESSEQTRGEGEDSSYFAGFGVRGLTDVVHEGLEALEYIGKKTMDVISEGDPGLRGKREVLMPKEPTLSQMLREAKEEAEYKASHPDHKESIVTFSTEFDKFQGLAHLEALEILSKESLSKVEAHFIDLSSEDLKSVKPLLRTIQEVVKFTEDEDENDDNEEQDFESEVLECFKDLNLTHIPNKTSDVDKRAKEWIDACITEQNENPLSKDHVEIFTAGISALAELTATTIEQFHKIAEVLLLLAENTDTSALVRAQSLKKLTVCVCREVSSLSSKFAGCLSTISKESQDPEAIECLITTLYLESSDSSRYLQHALKLLCPVLQHSSLTENTSAGK